MRKSILKIFSIPDRLCIIVSYLLYNLKLSNYFLKKYDSILLIINKLESKYKINTNFWSNNFIIESTKSKILLRKSSSDIQVFNQIFVEEEYKRGIEIITDRFHITNNLTIIDAGANIGLASIYFSKWFNNAQFILLEPFYRNADIAHKNCTLNNLQAQILNFALWKTDTNLKLNRDFRDKKEWSITVNPSESGEIKAITLNSLIKNLSLSKIDILKIDIEGSEFPVILETENINSILIQITAIIMEIHDDKGIREDIYRKLKILNFEIFELGELTLFINKSL